MLDNRKTIYDTLALLKSAGAVTASAAATVDGTATYFDTGGGFTEGKFVCDITAIAAFGAATGLQKFNLVLQGSNTTNFASYVPISAVTLGTAAQMARFGSNATIKATGVYIKPFNNMVGATLYRYLRVYHYINATDPGAGINYSAWLAK